MGKNRKIKYILIPIFLILFGLFSIKSHNDFGTYRVVEVFDGDTISVEMDGVVEKIRLIGADTPETVDPRKDVQCFGPEASAFTHSRLQVGTRVRLVADPLSTDRDRYDRLLRYVYLKDGTFYNRELIDNGFAFAYTGFPFTKLQEFKNSQENAKTKLSGIWGSCNT